MFKGDFSSRIWRHRGYRLRLNEEKKQQVIALGRLGWPLRKIQQATRIRRETASQYLKAAGIAVRPSGGWGRRAAKPANEVITDFGAEKPAIAVLTDPNGNPNRNPKTFLLREKQEPLQNRPRR